MAQSVIVDRNVLVPMRDGVRLATDIYRPAEEGRYPVLIHRIPYDKSNAWFVGGLILNPLVAVEHGYVVMVQDTRGRFGSEGDWIPFVHEAQDGYDAVEWATAQPWSNGNVGIYGSSYMGVTTLQAAAAAPPHLKAALSYVTGANYHSGWTYSGGAFELGFNAWWVLLLAWDTLSRLQLGESERQKLAAELSAAATDPWSVARHLPLREVPVFQRLAPYWRTWLEHPRYDEYWQAVDVATRAHQIKVPILHVTGWFDNFLRGHLDLNRQLREHPDPTVREHHHFIIGPWDHEAYLTVRSSAAGEKEFGPEAISGAGLMTGLALQWFDRWLKGDERSALGLPRVRYFTMGENRWREADAWPPAFRLVRYYLRSNGGANSRFGDGMLSLEAPTTDEPPDSYLYDPADPVPSCGGRTLHPVFGPGGIQDQREVEERNDVLVYTSPHLLEPVTIAGPVTVTLYAATSAPDTDFTAKLVDVQPDGYCANVAEGIIRARYRQSLDRAELVRPGEVTQYMIDLWDVAYTFRAGHRIRLEIASSNFPRFSRNLNCERDPEAATAQEMQVAVQRILHSATYPSHLTLPVAD